MAARSLNKVMLIGNLTRDPELRYTPQGTAVCSMSLATNRSWASTDGGERNEQTEYHRLVAWSKLAEICGQLLKKGRKIYVEGRLQTREWTGKDGQKRQVTEIVIENMIMLDAPRGGEEFAYADDTGVAAAAAQSQSKQKAKKTSDDAQDEALPEEQVSAEDISDDIPF